MTFTPNFEAGADFLPAPGYQDQYKLDFDNIIQFPGFFKIRLERTVETHQRKPALAGHGLDPVILLTSRYGRAKVDINRTVGVGIWIFLAVHTGIGLIGLQLRAGGRIVECNRPKVFGWHIGRQVEFIGFAAVKISTVAIPVTGQIARIIGQIR